MSYARMGFDVKEYDLAIIGGGPGGKFHQFKNYASWAN